MNKAVFDSVKKSIAYIEAHLFHDIAVRDVSDFVSYSQFYFSREFSRYTRISIYDYIIKRKISESYKRLFKEKMKIIDLAFQYGFQSHEVYTRAFKKVFKENPSEAVIYKPLAVYERIDDRYLEFLCELQVEEIDQPCEERIFEIAKPSDAQQTNDSLVQLSHTNLFEIENVFYGRLTSIDQNCLSFNLNGLKAIARIHDTDTQCALRFFTDNYYDVAKMKANYIVLRRANGYVDVLIPTAISTGD